MLRPLACVSEGSHGGRVAPHSARRESLSEALMSFKAPKRGFSQRAHRLEPQLQHQLVECLQHEPLLLALSRESRPTSSQAGRRPREEPDWRGMALRIEMLIKNLDYISPLRSFLTIATIVHYRVHKCEPIGGCETWKAPLASPPSKGKALHPALWLERALVIYRAHLSSVSPRCGET